MKTENQTARTPGPLRVVASTCKGNGLLWRDIVSDGTPFAPSYVGEALEADAILFAAAPELLAALDRILRAHDSGNNGAVMGEAVLCESFARQARAAIAQAEGRP